MSDVGGVGWAPPGSQWPCTKASRCFCRSLLGAWKATRGLVLQEGCVRAVRCTEMPRDVPPHGDAPSWPFQASVSRQSSRKEGVTVRAETAPGT